jgi:pimeloyl-ACP methyl ester carboxylesterase
MPRSRNRLDGRQVYFEDERGDGLPVVFHGGFLDSVADVRESNIARALPAGEFRRIYVDHRGLGASDKPHDPAATNCFSTPCCVLRARTADAVDNPPSETPRSGRPRCRGRPGRQRCPQPDPPQCTAEHTGVARRGSSVAVVYSGPTASRTHAPLTSRLEYETV